MTNPVDLPVHDFRGDPYWLQECSHVLRDGTLCNKSISVHPRADLTYKPIAGRLTGCTGRVVVDESRVVRVVGCDGDHTMGWPGDVILRCDNRSEPKMSKFVAMAVKKELQDAISEEEECARQAHMLEVRAMEYRKREEKARLARVELREFADVNGIDTEGLR